MKFLPLLALVSATVATPALSLYDNSAQEPLLGDVLPTSYPGFDLDLDAQRLVQLEGQEEPIVMTELEKVCTRPLFSPGEASFMPVTFRHSSRSEPRLKALGSSTCKSCPSSLHTFALNDGPRTDALDLGSRARFRVATKRVSLPEIDAFANPSLTS